MVKTSSTDMRNGWSTSRTGSGIARVARFDELEDLLLVVRVALERLQRRTADDRRVVAGEVIVRQELTYFELDEVEDLFVVDEVALVEEHDDVRHADLLREEHVLARLQHRAVIGGDDEDGAVHLGGTRDHVLDVVDVARAVDVRVVARVRLVLDVRDRDRDTALTLFRSVVDVLERDRLVDRARLVLRERRCDGSRERRFAVVDVTDGADVDVRLRPLELALRHCFLLELPLFIYLLRTCQNRRTVVSLRTFRLSGLAFREFATHGLRDLLVGVELRRERRASLRP